MNHVSKGKAVYVGADVTGEGLANLLGKLAGMAGVNRRCKRRAGLRLRCGGPAERSGCSC